MLSPAWTLKSLLWLPRFLTLGPGCVGLRTQWGSKGSTRDCSPETWGSAGHCWLLQQEHTKSCWNLMNATGPAHTDCIVTPNAATSCVSHCPQDGGALCLMFISQQEKLSLQGRAEAEGEDPVPAWWLPAPFHPLSDRTSAQVGSHLCTANDKRSGANRAHQGPLKALSGHLTYKSTGDPDSSLLQSGLCSQHPHKVPTALSR